MDETPQQTWPFAPSNSTVVAAPTVRERNRMHALNEAFDDLRRVVPKANLHDHQRLSKIATLRLAIHYITCLTQILQANGSFPNLTQQIGSSRNSFSNVEDLNVVRRQATRFRRRSRRPTTDDSIQFD